MTVKDGGTPAKVATATVLVTIKRNLFAPKFEPLRIDKNILESQLLGVTIATVNAKDKDTKVSEMALEVMCIITDVFK